MAEYCQECSIVTFVDDFQDFAGLSSAEDDKAGLYPVVLCEGCGAIQVDSKGRCVSKDCGDGGKYGHRAERHREYLSQWRVYVGAISGPRATLLRVRWALLGSPWYPGAIHALRAWWYDGPHYWVRGKRRPKEGDFVDF